MKKNQLGYSDLMVSELCLGTMTFGQQNTEAEAFSQLDFATQNGINIIDTAEMYPVPAKGETQGTTEQFIGNWFKKTGKRDDLILATKVVGPGYKHIRNGAKYNEEEIHEAVNGSLKRLQTNYIDVYQLHWPERKANRFDKSEYEHDVNDPWTDNFLEILQVLDGLKKEGKIRHFGLSNETPWGIMRYLQLAEKHNLPRPVSLQNPYHLLNRTLDIGISEVCLRENIGNLPYSPLAFGALSGKYLQGEVPGARLTEFRNFRRFLNPNAVQATEKYVALANEIGVTPSQLAIKFVTERKWNSSVIIGATSLSQLEENILSTEINLSEDVYDKIDEIHRMHCNVGA